MRFHPIGGGPEDDKEGQEAWFTARIASLIWIDRRLTGLAGPEYHAIISFGLPFESEDCQYGKSQFRGRAHEGGIAGRKAMIDRDHKLPLARQAKAVGISRGSIYYRPRPVGEAGLGLMRRIDELHLEYPFAGSRMIRGLLRQEGLSSGRRHIATLMRRMGIEALYRKPNTSRRRPGHNGVCCSVSKLTTALGVCHMEPTGGNIYRAPLRLQSGGCSELVTSFLKGAPFVGLLFFIFVLACSTPASTSTPTTEALTAVKTPTPNHGPKPQTTPFSTSVFVSEFDMELIVETVGQRLNLAVYDMDWDCMSKMTTEPDTPVVIYCDGLSYDDEVQFTSLTFLKRIGPNLTIVRGFQKATFNQAIVQECLIIEEQRCHTDHMTIEKALVYLLEIWQTYNDM